MWQEAYPKEVSHIRADIFGSFDFKPPLMEYGPQLLVNDYLHNISIICFSP
jgi:hypothetical protein